MQVQSLSALDVRCRMALARAIWGVDQATSSKIAYDTLRHFVQTIHGGVDPACPVAWPIQTDPVLATVYQEGMRLHKRRNALCEQLVLAKAEAQSRKDAQALALEQRLASEPSAQTLLEQLQMRKVVRLNQHSLSFDADFDGLAGTNPYGIDYCAGDMTLDNVAHWRTAMLSGQTWGASPVPEWDDSEDSPENTDVRELTLAIELVDAEFADLASMNWVSLAHGTDGFLDAQTEKQHSAMH